MGADFLKQILIMSIPCPVLSQEVILCTVDEELEVLPNLWKSIRTTRASALRGIRIQSYAYGQKRDLSERAKRIA
jgi:hypothetical protein